MDLGDPKITVPVFNYVIKKLNSLINNKASLKHSHSADDVTETDDKKFMTSEDKSKITSLITDGKGELFLSDNGRYISLGALTDGEREKISKILLNGKGDKVLNDKGEYILMSALSEEQAELVSKIIINGAGNKILTDNGNYVTAATLNIDDSTLSTSKTYSSSKLNQLLAAKLTSADLNKAVWDKAAILKTDGTTDEFLTGEGTYKTVEIFSPIDDNLTNSTTKTFSSKKISEMVNKKADAVKGMGLSTNDYTNEDRVLVKMLHNDGTGDYFLAKNGLYYYISNCGIQDDVTVDNATYSSSKIEKLVDSKIKNLVLPTQDDAPTFWEKTYENVEAGDVLEMQTELNYNLNNVIIQVYKFVDGKAGTIKPISTFTKKESDNFYFNPDEILFSDLNSGNVKLKDTYNIPITLNPESGFYESDVIHKGDYISIEDINSMLAEEV